MLKNLVLISVVLTFVVIVYGAFVRLTDAGLGCPDWPGCYGHLSVPESEEARQNAKLNFPEKEIETGKAWREMTHRYLAGMLGLLILAVAILSWRNRNKGVPVGIPTLLVALVIFQALLGMWTVTLLLKPVIVTLHLIGGMTILGTLVWLALRHTAVEPRSAGLQQLPWRKWATVGLFILMAQIALGGWVSSNYAALACTDFPLCQSQWLPPVDFHHAFQIVRDLGVTATGQALSNEALTAIHWSHRLGALITFTYLLIFGLFLVQVAALKFYGKLMLVFLFTQVGLGIANVVFSLPLALAVAHNATAALLLGSVVIINFILTRPHSNAIPS